MALSPSTTPMTEASMNTVVQLMNEDFDDEYDEEHATEETRRNNRARRGRKIKYRDSVCLECEENGSSSTGGIWCYEVGHHKNKKRAPKYVSCNECQKLVSGPKFTRHLNRCQTKDNKDPCDQPTVLSMSSVRSCNHGDKHMINNHQQQQQQHHYMMNGAAASSSSVDMMRSPPSAGNEYYANQVQYFFVDGQNRGIPTTTHPFQTPDMHQMRTMQMHNINPSQPHMYTQHPNAKPIYQTLSTPQQVFPRFMLPQDEHVSLDSHQSFMQAAAMQIPTNDQFATDPFLNLSNVREEHSLANPTTANATQFPSQHPTPVTSNSSTSADVRQSVAPSSTRKRKRVEQKEPTEEPSEIREESEVKNFINSTENKHFSLRLYDETTNKYVVLFSTQHKPVSELCPSKKRKKLNQILAPSLKRFGIGPEQLLGIKDVRSLVKSGEPESDRKVLERAEVKPDTASSVFSDDDEDDNRNLPADINAQQFFEQ